MEKNNKPQLHFSNNYDWTRTTFGETILSLKSGLSRMLSSDDIGLPVVRANNINQGNLDLNNNVKYWYKEDPQGANTDNYLIEKNDLLINFINSENKMGTTALVKENPIRPTIYTTNILNLRVKSKIDSYFIFMITQNFKYKKYIKLITKPAVNQSSFTTVDFKKFSFKLPSYEEQKKIGLFFKNLDDSISLHQQELDALKQTKQGFLQKMFPMGEETLPTIRFNSFVETWEQDEFGKVINLVGGATPLKENKEYWIGDIVWLSSQEIKNKYVSKGTYTISEKAVRDNRTKVVPIGTPLIVTRSGILAKRFPISISSNEVAINQDIKALIFDKTKIDTEFIVAQIKAKESYILNNIVKTGTTVQSVNLPDLNRMILHIPEYEEQVKIGEFFKQLDEVIDLKEKELEALKKTKQGFLQKMFV